MTKTHHYHKKSLAIIAMLFLLPPLYIQSAWLKVWFSDADANQFEKETGFLRFFPGSLSVKLIDVISIVCCLVAIILASMSFRQHNLSLRILMMLTVIFGSLLFLLDIFQLM